MQSVSTNPRWFEVASAANVFYLTQSSYSGDTFGASPNLEFFAVRDLRLWGVNAEA